MQSIKQKPLFDLFLKAIHKDRLSHLYLFAGPKGSGKKELAFEIAAQLLKYNGDGTKLHADGHMNLMFIEPSGQNIKKEQINDLQVEFSKTSLTNGSRIYIIDEVDKLSTAAANGLLKFLEEPLSKQTIGFLLSDNIETVLPTIQSRSQVMFLKPRSEANLKESLLSDGIDPYLSNLLPYLNKDKTRVIEMTEDQAILAMIELIKSYHQTLIKNDSLWFLMEKNMMILASDKTITKYFLELLLLYYMDLLKAKNGEDVSYSVFESEYELVLKHLNETKILVCLDEIQTILHRLNYNINIEMSLTQLVLRLEE